MGPWMDVAAVACGGAAGALTRWGIALVINHVVPDFPAGTMVINVMGSFLLGWAMTTEVGATLRVGLAIGFLGSFTTFSTFMYESDALIQQGRTWGLMLNVGLSIVLGLLALRLGLAVGNGAW